MRCTALLDIFVYWHIQVPFYYYYYYYYYWFSANCTAAASSIITSYWHDNVCLSVCDAVHCD